NLIISDRNAEGEFITLTLPENLPTAFVCNNDQVAYDLIELLQDKGYKVPDDISVASFDNTKFSIRSNPQITTVDNNVDEMVDVACKVIIKKIENPVKQYNRILIKTTLIERDSIKDINKEKNND
ncbi:MAG: substrate-binding domain-containing protein, partial [Bacilli bacterium]|nr:substrate-binding domain-containing protein [Bacilli bacterium]